MCIPPSPLKCYAINRCKTKTIILDLLLPVLSLFPLGSASVAVLIDSEVITTTTMKSKA